MKQNNKNAACNQVDESHQHNFKEKKLHKEEYMICDFTYKKIQKLIASGYINHQGVISFMGEELRTGSGLAIDYWKWEYD